MSFIHSQTGLIIGICFLFLGVSGFAMLKAVLIPALRKKNDNKSIALFNLLAMIDLLLFGGGGLVVLLLHGVS